MKTLLICVVALTVAASGVVLGQVAAAQSITKDGEHLKAAALQIDQLIASYYRNQKLTVPEVTDDATFLRRAFLVTIGRIPTAEEALPFLEIDDIAKREALVSYLLKSPGFSSHMSNWVFDLLRVTDQKIGGSGNNKPYRNWVRQAMADNMPWNQFTHKLIASSGDGWDPQTAAVGYYTRDRGMPLDNLSNSMRVFLGSRMECAQCHDDPFGTTERHDFYELAAFTHGQEELNIEFMQPLWSELEDDQKEQGEEYRLAQLLWDQVYGMSLGGKGSGQIALPSDYQYRDAEPGKMVGGRTPFGRTVRMSEKRAENDGRGKLADWMVNKTNHQFAAIIANRMWKRVMGQGLYEPVDTFVVSERTGFPALVTYLTLLMENLNYDLKAFQNVLLLTKTFQFATNPKPSTVEGGDDFHGRKIERLSSEQIWDSLITLAVGDPDLKQRRLLDERIYLDGKPILVGKKTMPELSREVLALNSENAVRSFFSNLLKEVKTAPTSPSANDSMMMVAARSDVNDAKIRASELPSPAPRDHFLSLFGASDREVVEGASRDPNVGQVLSLMNGFVQRELVHQPKAHLYQSLTDASSAKEKIRRLYVAILTRPPTEQEMDWMLDEVKDQGDVGFQNIVSALVMSSEFLFLQ